MNGELKQLPTIVPLFPLPEIVLFPRAILPLHIFEPRYRAMAVDAQAGDGTLAVALLKPGFEPLYFTRRAPIHPVLGVGRIVASEELADGNYNILLRGEARARLLEELEGRPYRRARIRLLPPSCTGSPETLLRLRQQLSKEIRISPLPESHLREHWLKLLGLPLDLGQITDLIASGLPVAGELKLCYLAETDVPARAAMLLAELQTIAAVIQRRRNLGTPEQCRLN